MSSTSPISATFLGSGTFGSVLAIDGKACKYFCSLNSVPTMDDIENWMKEVTIRAILGNETGICPMLSMDYKTLSFSMETYDSNLEEYAKELSENELESLLLDYVHPQVCEQLVLIHAQGLAHMDLKPSNILIKKVEGRYRIALADFGSSTLMQGRPQTSMTTKAFIPNGAESLPLDYRYDMYGLGMSLLTACQVAEVRMSQRVRSLVATLIYNYQDVPKPESFCSVKVPRREAFLPLWEQGTKRSLASSLCCLLASKYPTYLIKSCNCLSLLLRGASILEQLSSFSPIKEENIILDPQVSAFLNTYTSILTDPEALKTIRSFLVHLTQTI